MESNVTTLFNAAKSAYQDAIAYGLDTSIIKMLQLDYIRMMLIKSNGVNLDTLEIWAVNNNSKSFFSFVEEDCQYLLQEGFLKQEDRAYRFLDGAKARLFEHQRHNTQRNIQLVLSNKSLYEDSLYKATIGDSLNRVDAALEEEEFVEKFLQHVSKLHNTSFGNALSTFFHAQQYDIEISLLKSVHEWREIDAEIKIATPPFQVIVLNPKSGNGAEYFRKHYYDISQTSLDKTNFLVIKNEVSSKTIEELAYSFSKSSLSSLFDTVSKDFKSDMDPIEKMKILAKKSSEYFFFNQNERNMFEYLFFKSFGVEDVLFAYGVTKENLINVVTTFNHFSKELFLPNIAYSSKVEKNIFYEIGKKDASKISTKEATKECKKIANINDKNLYKKGYDSGFVKDDTKQFFVENLANYIVDNGFYKIESIMQNLFLSTKVITITQGGLKGVAFHLDGDLSDADALMQLKKDFLQNEIKKSLKSKSSVEYNTTELNILKGKRDESTTKSSRNEELQRGEHIHDNEKLPGRVQAREVSRASENENIGGSADKKFPTSTSRDEHANQEWIAGVGSLGNSKQGVHLHLDKELNTYYSEVTSDDVLFRVYDDGSVCRKSNTTWVIQNLTKELEDKIRAKVGHIGNIPSYSDGTGFYPKGQAVGNTKALYKQSLNGYKLFIEKLNDGKLPINTHTIRQLNQNAHHLEIMGKELNITREDYKNERELRNYSELDTRSTSRNEEGNIQPEDERISQSLTADIQGPAEYGASQRDSFGVHENTHQRRDYKSIKFDINKSYSTKGIYQDYPSNKISKLIQKDVAKYAQQLAENLGYEYDVGKNGKKLTHNGVSDNIAPAGGGATFILWKPNSDYGVYICLSYRLGFDDDRYDTYELDKGEHLWRTTSKKDKYTGHGNQWIKVEDLASENFVKKIAQAVNSKHQKNLESEPAEGIKNQNLEEFLYKNEVVEEVPQTTSNFEMITLKFRHLLEDAVLEDFEHTKTSETLNIFKISKRLSKEEYGAFNSYLKKNHFAYYSNIAKGFIIKDESLLKAFKEAPFLVPNTQFEVKPYGREILTKQLVMFYADKKLSYDERETLINNHLRLIAFNESGIAIGYKSEKTLKVFADGLVDNPSLYSFKELDDGDTSLVFSPSELSEYIPIVIKKNGYVDYIEDDIEDIEEGYSFFKEINANLPKEIQQKIIQISELNKSKSSTIASGIQLVKPSYDMTNKDFEFFRELRAASMHNLFHEYSFEDMGINEIEAFLYQAHLDGSEPQFIESLNSVLKRKEDAKNSKNTDIKTLVNTLDEESLRVLFDKAVKSSNKNLRYEIVPSKKEFKILNLKEFYNSDQIKTLFINKTVGWEIFSNKYIFDLSNQEHLDLLQNELNMHFETKGEEVEKISQDLSFSEEFSIRDESNGEIALYLNDEKVAATLFGGILRISPYQDLDIPKEWFSQLMSHAGGFDSVTDMDKHNEIAKNITQTSSDVKDENTYLSRVLNLYPILNEVRDYYGKEWTASLQSMWDRGVYDSWIGSDKVANLQFLRNNLYNLYNLLESNAISQEYYLSLTYPFMDDEEKQEHEDILDSVISKRTHKIAIDLGFESPKEWLKYAKFTTDRDGSNNVAMSVFGVDDEFKPLDAYLNEIKTTDRYKSYITNQIIFEDEEKTTKEVAVTTTNDVETNIIQPSLHVKDNPTEFETKIYEAYESAKVLDGGKSSYQVLKTMAWNTLNKENSENISFKAIEDILDEAYTQEDFTIEEDISAGGAKTKFKNNIVAIEVIRKLERDEELTKEDKIALSKYVGWGGLSQAFYKTDGTVTKGWENEAEELKHTMTEEEYKQARGSVLDSFYTNDIITKAMWKAVDNFGFNRGSVLEPSVGVGNFFGYMPKHLKPNTQLLGVEIEPTTAKIAKALYPKAKILNMPFEDTSLSDNSVTLAIGNPPYGSHKIHCKVNEKLDGMSIHNYFMCKTIDKVEPNGVMAMVVSNSFMDSQDLNARAYIGEKANLIGAIRLPNNAFSKNANTEVTTDILFFQKRSAYGMKSNLDEWLHVGELNDTPINKYFVDHQEKLLGKWGRYGTMYQGGTPALVARPEQDTKALLDKAIEELPRYVQFNNGNYYYSTYRRENTSKLMETAGFNNKLAITLQSQNGETMTCDARINTYFVNDDKLYMRFPDVNGEAVAKEITTRINSQGSEVDLSPKEIERIKGMIEVAHVATLLKNEQLNENSTEDELEELRAKLNRTYDAFKKSFGFLNNANNKKYFEDDVRAPFLLALESKYDKGVSKAASLKSGETVKKESAKKADIFFKRTQTPYVAPTSASSIKDAFVISLSEKAFVDMRYIASLVSKEEKEVEEYLSKNGLIFDDPNYGWVTKEEYLSGNVKQKLRETNNPINIAALKEVIPKDIEAIDISVQPGASWIPASDIRNFVREITGDKEPIAKYIEYSASWHISSAETTEKKAQYGTSRKKVVSILDAALNNKQVTVYDYYEDENGNKKSVINQEDTIAANDKLEAVKIAWENWIWKDSERRERLAKLYNEKFNVYARREYDGSHLKLPGKISDSIIELRPHQKNAVWRALQSGRVLCDHTVGTGKTMTAIASVMELKRTGKAKKPLIVVPNHIVEQWGKEFLELYPNANILLPTKNDFSANRRKVLMSRIATGEYDAIIIAHSQLIKITNDPKFEISFLEKQIRDIQSGIDAIRRAEGKETRSIKQWQTTQKSLEAKIKKLGEVDKDDNLTFLELGIDAMVVDESHEFKNLQFFTSMQRVAGLGNPEGSKKAFDLYIKTQSLLEKTGNKNLMFLTGTPISNTIAEMFTIQRYLQGQELAEDRLNHFDAWVKQYAEAVADWELSASGKYKLKNRLSKFKNVPELIASYSQFADVITREHINKQLAKDGKKLPVPKVKGGKPQNVIVERSEDQANYIGVADENGEYNENSLVYRSEHLPQGQPKKGDDNMLVIMSDARKASLDMRMHGDYYEDFEGSKVNECIRQSLRLYHKWADKRGTQLIFCDLSTPKGAISDEKARIEELIRKADAGEDKAIEELDKLSTDDIASLNNNFSVYDDMKAKLIKAGVPQSEIAFIHDAKTDKQKEDLFAKVNGGRVRFLFGSTTKMGTGTNVQKKIVGLHSLDAPWRPDQLEQREGRGIRQGNELYEEDPEGFEIEVLRYATKNTLDSRMWEILETKGRFIEQLKLGNVDAREVEDIASEATNAAEMKAASSGNPLILEEMTLKQNIKKMEAIKREHNRSLYDREEKIKKFTSLIEQSDKNIENYEIDVKTYSSYEAKMDKLEKEHEIKKVQNKLSESKEKIPDFSKFLLAVGPTEYSKREDAGAALLKKARELKIDTNSSSSREERHITVGTFAGFEISIYNLNPLGNKVDIYLNGQNEYVLDGIDIKEQNAGGLAQKINFLASKIDLEYRMYLENIAKMKDELPILVKANVAFPKEEELSLLKQRHKAVVQELQADDKKPNTGQNAVKELNKQKISSIKSYWVDNDKELSSIELLQKRRVDISILEHIEEYRYVGNCLVIDTALERDVYLRFQKLFESFGGKWDKSMQAVVFNEEGLVRIKDVLKENEIDISSQIANVVASANASTKESNTSLDTY